MGNKSSSTSSSPDTAKNPDEPGVEAVKPTTELPSELPRTEEVNFGDVEASLKTADLVLLYKPGQSLPTYASFIDYKEIDPYFPHLLVRGKSLPMEMADFIPHKLDVCIHTAETKMFYGGYEKVAVRKLTHRKGTISSNEAMNVAEAIKNISYSEKEKAAVSRAKSAEESNAIVSTYVVAHFYKQLGILEKEPADLLPETLESALPLEEAMFFKLPPVKHGAMSTGKPPFLARLVDGIRPPPDYTALPYCEIREQLQTGDIVLFSGATTSGAVIKMFDGSVFSHVGIVVRPQKFTDLIMVWESSTNKAGLVDVTTGSVTQGVELLPLKHKIFSGWYDKVAIRKLTGLSDDERDEMCKKLLQLQKKFQGCEYEQNHVELMLSAIDFYEDYLTFLKNSKEDLSSLFCSELVAHAYQELGLLDKSTKVSNEYTPDDFASHRKLELLHGHLEDEVYIELKFDGEA